VTPLYKEDCGGNGQTLKILAGGSEWLKSTRKTNNATLKIARHHYVMCVHATKWNVQIETKRRRTMLGALELAAPSVFQTLEPTREECWKVFSQGPQIETVFE
jgi:hypothetical protein